MAFTIAWPGAAAPDAAPPAFEIVAIAASVGGIQALKVLVAGLPTGFRLPVLVCQHVHRARPSQLPAILALRTSLRVVAAETGMSPASGTIYVAPSNRHLLVGPDRKLILSDAERVNWCRPAADVLFRSVADAYGARAIGLVLTGYGRDGALGSRALTERGGLVIAQDQASAEAFDMPLFARDLGGADLVLPLGQMAPALATLAELEEAPPPFRRVGEGFLDGASGKLGTANWRGRLTGQAGCEAGIQQGIGISFWPRSPAPCAARRWSRTTWAWRRKARTGWR